MSAEVVSQGLGGKLGKLGRILGFSDNPAGPGEVAFPQRETDDGRASREEERRRNLYEDVGRFLFVHNLDLTPLNFGLAVDYITGRDLTVEKAVRAVIAEKGKLSNGLAEQLIAELRADELTPDALNEILTKVESNLGQLTGLVDQSSTSAKDFGVALQKEAAELVRESAGNNTITNLISLTRSMVEKTREAEQRMREGQRQTRLLQKNLESARRAAEQDHLTGLPNRRCFEATLREEHKLALARSEPLSVAFCDIDHFKIINDSHGHDAGDRVLKFVAGLLARISGDKCHVARHGGEEFVMLFRGVTVAEAARIVNEARTDMAERNLVDRQTGERMQQVTFSGGVADIFAYAEPGEALKAADRALYLAKEHGRNRVYIAGEVE